MDQEWINQVVRRDGMAFSNPGFLSPTNTTDSNLTNQSLIPSVTAASNLASTFLSSDTSLVQGLTPDLISAFLSPTPNNTVSGDPLNFGQISSASHSASNSRSLSSSSIPVLPITTLQSTLVVGKKQTSSLLADSTSQNVKPMSAKQRARKPKAKRKRTKMACRTCYLVKKRCGPERPCSRCVQLGLVCEERTLGDSRPTKKKLEAAAMIPWQKLRPEVSGVFRQILQQRLSKKAKDLAAISLQASKALDQRCICTAQSSTVAVTMLKCDDSVINSPVGTQMRVWTSCPPSCESKLCRPQVLKYYWNPALQNLIGYNMEEVMAGYQREGDLYPLRWVKAESKFKLLQMMGRDQGTIMIECIHRSGREFRAALQWRTTLATEPPHLSSQVAYIIPEQDVPDV